MPSRNSNTLAYNFILLKSNDGFSMGIRDLDLHSEIPVKLLCDSVIYHTSYTMTSKYYIL